MNEAILIIIGLSVLTGTLLYRGFHYGFVPDKSEEWCMVYIFPIFYAWITMHIVDGIAKLVVRMSAN